MTAPLRQNRDSRKAFVLCVKDSYCQDARDFVTFLGQRGLDLTLGGLRGYLKDIWAQGVSAQTFNMREDIIAVLDAYGNMDHNALLSDVYEKYPACAKKSHLRRGRSAK